MTDDDEVIFSYTDREAIEDGVLFPVPGHLGVNRVTLAVFVRFFSPLLDTMIEVLMKTPANENGWRMGTYQGQELWLIPNEVRGLTMMFPDDY